MLPVGVLVAGLILGAIVILVVRSRRAAATLPADDLALRDLEARRDALLQQLRGEVDDAERVRLERDAADVLRAIDAQKRVARPAPTRPAKVDHRAAQSGNPAMRGFLWGAGSVGAIALLAWFVVQQSKPRGANEEITGGQPGPMQQQAQGQQPQMPPDPAVQQLEATVRQAPDNLQARNELAKAYLERDNLMGVFEQTQYVLAKTPGDARALTYQSIVRMAMGDAASATKMLDQATASDPALLDAWVALAWIRFQTGKPKEAEEAIAEAARRHPEEQAKLDQLLVQMKQAASQQQQASSSPTPPDHPPVDGAPAATAAADAKAITINVTLDPAARARAGNGVVFVIARAAGVAAGPPAAAKRLTLAQLTGPITISSADSMMGQPLPDKVRIDVRLDSDGDPNTRPPTDPKATQDGVAAGSVISLTLQ
jgi:tetratricopeptide (TPR) repeat protein